MPSVLSMYGTVLGYLASSSAPLYFTPLYFDLWNEKITLTPILFVAFWCLAGNLILISRMQIIFILTLTISLSLSLSLISINKMEFSSAAVCKTITRHIKTISLIFIQADILCVGIFIIPTQRSILI